MPPLARLIVLVASLSGAGGCLLPIPDAPLRKPCVEDRDCGAFGACLEGRCQGGDAGVVEPDVPDPIEDGWHDPGLAFRSRVDVNNEGVVDPLINVPIQVSIISGHPALDALDQLAFYDDDGVRLPHEIEGAAVPARIWVRPTQIPRAGNDADIWLYFDGEGAPEDPGAVWENHLAVWHLGEDPDLSFFRNDHPRSDLTVNEGMLEPRVDVDSTNGRVALGARLGPGGYLRGSSSARYQVGPGEVRTYSLWAVDIDLSNNPFLFNKELRGEDECYGPSLQVAEQGSILRAAYRFGGCDDDDDDVAFIEAEDLSLGGEFRLYTFVVDHGRNRADLYVDKTLVGSATGFQGDDAEERDVTLVVGGGPESGGSASTFQGIVDEVRVTTRAATQAECVFRHNTEQRGALVSNQVEPRP